MTPALAFAWLSLALTVLAYLPYMISTARGRTRPHVFSWTLWGLLMLVAAAGQQAGDAGPGAWATAASAVFCIIIAVQALLQKGDRSIRQSDVAVFAGGLLALPLWYVTQDPLSAIIMVTLIDAAGYAPTLRKSWHAPWHEMPYHYIVSNLKHLSALAAMQVFSMTTVLYPAALLLLNTALVCIIYGRRRRVPATA